MGKKPAYWELEQRVKELEEEAAKRKKAEKARNEIEKRYQVASVAGEVGVWDWDLKTDEIYLDPNLKAMLGYRDNEIRNHLDDWGKYVHPDDAELVMTKAEAHLQGKTPFYEVTHRMLHKDGSIRWFLARGKAIRDAKGKPYRVLGTDTNITERKIIEAALEESEEKYRSLYDSMNEGVALHEIIYDQSGDPVDYRVLDVNGAFQSILGIQKEQAVGSKASKLYGTDKPPYIDIYAKVAQQGAPALFETYFEPIDKHFSISVFSPKRGEFATVFSDITEQKQVDEALKKKIIELNSFINNIPDMAWVKDSESRFIVVNSAFGKAVGIAPEILINETCEVCFGKEGAKKFREDDLRVIQTRKQEIIEEKIFDSKKNEVWLETVKSPILDESGKVVGTVGVSRDITDRKHAEMALQESEAKYRQLVEYAPAGIYEIDIKNQKFNSVNDVMCEYLGYTKEELLSMSPFDLLTEESKQIVLERHKKISAGEPVSETTEYQLKGKNGKEFWGLSNARFIYENGIPVRAFVVVHDITERMRVEAALQESERSLHDLSSHLLSVQERERRRISLELHDDLGQELSVLKLKIGSIARKLKKDPTTLEEDCDTVLGSVDQIIENVRRLSRDLSPSILEDLGLPSLDSLGPRLRWVSPLEKDKFTEYRDTAFLQACGFEHLSSDLRKFWPLGGPVWDALARVEYGEVNTGKGVLLVEAKSHPPEIYGSGCQASPKSRRKIEEALLLTKRWLGVKEDIDWTGPLYQSTNRLAHLYFFREIVNVQAWLVNAYFINDPHSPTDYAEWQRALMEVKTDLGISGLEVPHMADIFFEAGVRNELYRVLGK